MSNTTQGIPRWLNRFYRTSVKQIRPSDFPGDLIVAQRSGPYLTPSVTPVERDVQVPVLRENNRELTDTNVNLESVYITRAPSAHQVRAPRLKELLELIEQIRIGKYERTDDQTLIKKDLRTYEYRQLLRILQNPQERKLRVYFETRLRYDYLPSRNLFVIRTITVVHEIMTRGIEVLISSWLKTLHERRWGSKEVSKAARVIAHEGHRDIMLSGIGSRQPDNSYRHIQCKFPGLVFKIAWSERASELRESAEEFIDETGGGVRTVVGINLSDVYEARKRGEMGDAKLCVWRAKFDPSGKYSGIEKTEDRIFQSRAERAVDSTALEISLQDILCPKVAKKLAPNDPKLRISAKQLSHFLKEGLARLQLPDEESESASESDGSQDIPPATPDSPCRRITERFTDSLRRPGRVWGLTAGHSLP